MLVGNEPIGRFIALANLDKNIISQNSIEQEIENLVDLIIVRSKDKSIEEVANSLLSNVLDLRFEVFDWLGQNDKSTTDYFDSLNKHISVNLQMAPYSELGKTISSVLLTYEKITSSIIKSLPSNSFKEILKGGQKVKLKYDAISFLLLHPSPQVKYIKNWIDSSLQLEIGLILTDLILTNQIDFPKRRIKKELIEFLNTTITRYGAYSIFTGYWSPDYSDLSSETNKMKILSATIELENKVFHKTSKEGLFKMINN